MQVEIDRWTGSARVRRKFSESVLAPYERPLVLKESASTRGVYLNASEQEILRLTRRGANVTYPDQVRQCRWNGSPAYVSVSMPARW